MPQHKHEPRAIIIGCGVAGISMAYNMKQRLNFHNFVIYEKEPHIGGTWYRNTYPGVGCDVDSHLYSLSFNLNPDWSKRFAEAPEILEYINATADKFGISEHVRTSVEVTEAEWIEPESCWRVRMRDLQTAHTFEREAEILVSCVGTLGIPKKCTIPHLEEFQGHLWHSGKWNHEVDYTGKRVAVVGNGCSAAQLVPKVAEKASHVTQFQRSPQWINERPNRRFTTFEKWCFRYLPAWNRLYRFWIWKDTDALHTLYQSDTPAMVAAREKATQEAVDYMKAHAPKKYHDAIIPKFPLGCKRRIFDPGYLDCLHRSNVELTTEKIVEFTPEGLRTDQRDIPFDIVVLSTGFNVQEFVSPIKVIGRGGKTLNEHWKDTRGAQAYRGTFVSGFPNFGIIFGPNAFPAHNSVIYTNETQAEFFAKAAVNPIVRGDFDVLDVKESAEMQDSMRIKAALDKMVWSGGCSNWNLDQNGRNTTNYHDPTWKFWWSLYWPQWSDFEAMGGKGTKPPHPLLSRFVISVTGLGIAALLGKAMPLPSLASVSRSSLLGRWV
ncbi:FAD/NAD(P)-binding domain-containing protein [Aspergillus pseudocaelatus]|uniref:FAD/NAD(P)-binding domain-containing protein n=1 Tax=Aspergillus pseudocaelatus TaxID=1825620 RepID=A0ABQ6X2L1_9EURO|nr:FAD/NAD(P)-binding domain-containing protein [Aspergillus pseudocaelatus]